MQSSKQGKVTGMKAFKGNIDGQEIDGCTIFVEAKLKGENSKGYASQSYKWGKSEKLPPRSFHRGERPGV